LRRGSDDERGETELRDPAAELRQRDAIADTFVAKSFTDRHLIVDGEADSVPADVSARLAAHDLRGADEVYGSGEGGSFAGELGEATRHHFVDSRTRGDHHSYVVH